MKKIVLLPVKNEAWILRQSLHNFSSFADHIIVADQSSTDGSREIYKEFPKVIMIENPANGHSNSVRWLLLDSARKMFGYKNLIICIDADEMVSKEAIAKMEEFIQDKSLKSLSFQLPWVQLWKDVNHYRNDGVWANNFKTIAFVDSKNLDYQHEEVINDHTSRVPLTENVVKIDSPLLHFQYVAFESAMIKQAWYRASELIDGKKSARYINYKYSITKECNSLVLNTPTGWLEQIPEARLVQATTVDSWNYKTLLNWFQKYGVNFFEPLDIWDIPKLRKIFIEENQRSPVIKKYPNILIKIKTLINKILK